LGGHRRCSTGRAPSLGLSHGVPHLSRWCRGAMRQPQVQQSNSTPEAPASPPPVRRLRPGLSSKGHRQTARGVGSGQAGRAGQARQGFPPTRHRGLNSRGPAPKQRAEAARVDRVVRSLPSHANRRRKNSEGWQRMGTERCFEIQISLLRPVLHSAPGTSAGLDTSCQIFLHFCFALLSRPSAPTVCHIYPHSLCTKYGASLLSMTV